MDPIRREMFALLKDPAILDGILKKGGEAANDLASQNLREIKEIVGFLRT